MATAQVTGITALARSYGDYNKQYDNVTTSGAILIDIKNQYDEDNIVDISRIIQKSINNQVYVPWDDVNTTTGSAIRFNLDLPIEIKMIEDLSQESLKIICNQYEINEEMLLELEGKGYSVKECIYLSAIVSEYSFTIEEVDRLMQQYYDSRMVEREIRYFNEFITRNDFDSLLVTEAKNILLEGHELKYLQYAVVVASSLGENLSDVISKEEKFNRGDNRISLSNLSYQSFCNYYYVDLAWLTAYLLMNNITIETLFQKVEDDKDVTWLIEMVRLQPLEYDIDYEKYENSPLKSGVLTKDYVDIRTGEVMFEDVDLSLPGKNGLDFNLITRYEGYNSYFLEPAHIYNLETEYDVYVTYKGVLNVPGFPKDYYYYSQYDKDEKYVDTYADQASANNKKESLKANANNLTHPINEEYFEYEAIVRIEEKINYASSYSINGYKTKTNNEKRNHLGTGWSFAFSYIEFVTEEDKNENIVRNRYLHTADGGIHKIKRNIDSDDNGFEDYDLYDIKIRESRDYINNDGVQSKYVVVYDNLINEYFDDNGYLIGITDRANNSIDFVNDYFDEIDRTMVSEVTDTYGRNITFEYTENKVTVTDPDGEEIEYHLSRIKDTDFKDAEDYYNLATLNGDHIDYKLSYKEDRDNRKTEYEYIGREAGYSFISYDENYSPNYCLTLRKIEYPSDAVMNFDYHKKVRCLGNIGSEERYVIWGQAIDGDETEVAFSLGDEIDVSQIDNNHYLYKDYYYGTNNYSGVRDNGVNYMPDENSSKKYSVEVGNIDGLITRYTFNYRHLLVDVDVYCEDSNNDKIYKSLIDYNYNDYNLVTQVKERIYDDDEENYIVTYKNYEYDTDDDDYEDKYGLLTGYWGPMAERSFGELDEGSKDNDKHKISYKYDGLTRRLAEKIYYQNEDIKIIEEYVIDSNVYKPKEENIYIKNERFPEKEKESVSKTAYEYDDNTGELKETKAYYDIAGDKYYTTEYIYNYGYDKTNPLKYSMTRRTIGVEDADNKLVDGNEEGVIKEIFYYDVLGNLEKHTNAKGLSTEYKYDAINRVEKIIYPNLKEENYDYSDGTNHVIIDDEEKVLKYQYNDIGKLDYVQNVDTKEFLRKYTYNKYAQLDKEYSFNYDVKAEVGIINGKMSITNYDYNDYGQLEEIEITDLMGNQLYRERYYYDDAYELDDEYFNKVTKVIKGEEGSESIGTVEYRDILGNVVKHGREYGRGLSRDEALTTTTYDFLGNKVGETSQKINQKIMSDEEETLTNLIGNRDSEFVYNYDFLGNIQSVNDVENNTYKYIYDDLGRLKEVEDPKEHKKYYDYDALNRLIKEKETISDLNENSDVAIIKHYYDNMNNEIMTKTSAQEVGKNAKWHQTDYLYDKMNRLTKVTAHDAGNKNITQYFYDSAGNRIRMYTGLSDELYIYGVDKIYEGNDHDYITTKYGYDQFGNITSIIDGLNHSQNFRYDIRGNLVQKIDKNSVATKYEYDELNQLKRMTTYKANNRPNISYGGNNDILDVVAIMKDYDRFTIEDKKYEYAYYKTGLKKFEKGEDVTVNFEYDELGRLDKEMYGNNVIKDYSYDFADNRTQFKLTVGSDVKMNTTYTYDSLNRLEYVYENDAQEAKYVYDDNGNRQTLIYPNGNVIAYSYNERNQLKTLISKKGNTELSSFKYDYALDGNQISEENTVNNEMRQFIYDGIGRLKQEKYTSGLTNNTAYDLEFTYDDAHNRATKKEHLSGEQVVYGYNKNNQLKTETITLNGVTEVKDYDYDLNGNQTKVTRKVGNNGNVITTSTYDTLNRLTRVIHDGVTSEYTYKVNGLRKSKIVNGEVTKHIWDGNNLAFEQDEQGNDTGKYVRGINLISGTDKYDNKSYYLFNGHGDVLHLANTNGTVKKNYSYDAFGNQLAPDVNDMNPFRYCGEYFDGETETIYLRARYYNPSVGRFVSEDSYLGDSSDPLSLNLYTYTHNNPVMYADPSGHSPTIAYVTYKVVQGILILIIAYSAKEVTEIVVEEVVYNSEVFPLPEGEEVKIYVNPLPDDDYYSDSITTTTIEDGYWGMGLPGTSIDEVDSLGLVQGNKITENNWQDYVTYTDFSNGITINDDKAGHIFRDAEGHLKEDTARNRGLLEDVANNNSNHLGMDRYGNDWYSKTQTNGSQLWTQVRNGKIINGGINSTPKVFNENTGLSNPKRGW